MFNYNKDNIFYNIIIGKNKENKLFIILYFINIKEYYKMDNL